MDDYRKYLAEQILTADQVITYRTLSRALKVHVNTAKQMLFDFHKWQNDKRPGAVYATYLVYGLRKDEPGASQVPTDGDVEMASSLPEAELLSEVVPVFTLALVREDELKAVLAEYEEASSIHVYSVGPHPMKDSAMLSDVARKVPSTAARESDPKSRAAYGTISNPSVRRRERKGIGAQLAAASATAADIKAVPTKTAPPSKDTAEPATTSDSTRRETASSAPAGKKAPAVPSLKRGGSSGIMQSFAKAAAKPKKAVPSGSASASAADEEASGVNALSDDGEDDSEAPPQPDSEVPSAAGRKSRRERQEELRKMMDDDDEEDDEEKAESQAESPAEEAAEEEEEPLASTAPEKEEPAEVVSTDSGDGRRRGRRRVMRKKQVMDEQGYLVTIQEQGWESFSEDEKAPASKAGISSSAPAAAQANKPKKATAKGNQGNIMSFFAKK